MRRRIKIVKDRILAVLLSVILAASCFLIPLRPVQASAIGLDLALSGSTTVGEMLYGLFATAGLTTLAVNRDSDSLFSNKYSLDNLVETGKLVPVDGSYKNASWDNVMNDIKSDAEAGNSSFAKNTVVPVTVSYEKLAGGLPGPTPTPGGGTLVKSGIQWLGKRLQMIANAGMISINLLSGTPDMSMVLRDYAQPQVEYSMEYGVPSSLVYDNVLSGYNTLSSFSTDGLSKYCSYVSGSSSNPFAYARLNLIPSDSIVVAGTDGKWLIFYSSSPSTYYYSDCASYNSSSGASWEAPISAVLSKTSYTDANGNTLYSSGMTAGWKYKLIGVDYYLDDKSNLGSFLSTLDFSNLPNKGLPNLITKNGNISDVNSIQPAINPDQAMRVPSADAIQNYITNQNNTTNQNDIINNYNNFVNNYITEAPVEPIEPVEPDVPVVPDMPAVDPDPQPSPPAEDDENSSYLSPNLKEYFPFCIPWDIASIFQNFTAERKAPKFTFTLKSERFGFSEDIVVDLSTFDSVASILRLLELILFIIALAAATRALIGAL